jgi:hypothetical protein
MNIFCLEYYDAFLRIFLDAIDHKRDERATLMSSMKKMFKRIILTKSLFANGDPPIFDAADKRTDGRAQIGDSIGVKVQVVIPCDDFYALWRLPIQPSSPDVQQLKNLFIRPFYSDDVSICSHRVDFNHDG